MTAPESHQVVFTPSGLSGTVDDGTTVLEAARQIGADLDTVCGGRGICGRCQIVPSVGEFAKWGITSTAVNFGPKSPLETDYRGQRPLVEGQRLGCVTAINGDVVIDIPPASQIHKQVIRKGVDVGDLILDPRLTLHFIVIDRARFDLDDGASAVDVIAEQIETDWGFAGVDIDPLLLPQVHAAVDPRHDGELTVALRDHNQIVGLWPGYVDQIGGVAIDVGSTTVAGHLCDLTSGEILASSGRMNPQIRFGEDLMSRVSYVMMNPGGAADLTTAIRTALDELVGELVEQSGLNSSQVLDIVLVGNPVMHHIALGIDPTPLGQSPFTLATNSAINLRATDLGINSPAALYFGPCIAGHVGADTAAAVLSEGPHRGEAVQLLVDVGTNAEIVLGSRDRQFAASSPTGPAFEGAQISAGQRATAGAIERVRIDRDTLEPRFRVIGSELWSDEPGFAEATAATGITGICGSGIIEVISEMYLSGIIDTNGVLAPSLAERTSRVVPDERTAAYILHEAGDHSIRITQADVRAIQLAKAALRAGIELLLEKAEITEIDDIRLAGAFGAHIDPLHAMVLGLVPDCPLDRVRSVGNAAGSGAVRALLSRQQRTEMEVTVAAIIKIETATEPAFQEHFVAALAFPHRDALTPNLAAATTLPPRVTVESGAPRRRRRRSS